MQQIIQIKNKLAKQKLKKKIVDSFAEMQSCLFLMSDFIQLSYTKFDKTNGGTGVE
jgi:hypothetical protein